MQTASAKQVWSGCEGHSVSVESTRPMGKQLFEDPKKGRFARCRDASQGYGTSTRCLSAHVL